MAEPEKPPAVVVGQAATGVGTAGKAPVALIVDLNANGIEDYREPWFWKTVLNASAWFARSFAPSYTMAYRIAEDYQAKVKPELEKATGERYK